MKTRHFCTYFDSNYLPLGLALYQSLQRHCDDARLYVLCLDKEAYRILDEMSLPNLEAIPLSTLEEFDRELLAVKSKRSKVEYIFSCTAAWMYFLLNTKPEVPFITYLDSDIYFFANPETVFEEVGDSSVAIIEHRFSKAIENEYLQFGKYNVGWVSFKNDQAGLTALKWWREKCIEWCFDYIDGDRFADQKYLEQFPQRFSGVISIEHPGANAARWNLADSILSSSPSDTLLIDGKPLVFFHFEGIRQITNDLFNVGLSRYLVPKNRLIIDRIYKPYISQLLSIRRTITPGVARVIPLRRTDQDRSSWSGALSFLRKLNQVFIATKAGDCLRVAVKESESESPKKLKRDAVLCAE